MLLEKDTLLANTMLQIEHERLAFSKVLTVRAKDYHLFLLKLLKIIAIGNNNIDEVENPLDNILKYYNKGYTLYDYFKGELKYYHHRQLVSHHLNPLDTRHRYREQLNRDLQICVGLGLIKD